MDNVSFGGLPMNDVVHDNRMIVGLARVNGRYRDRYAVCTHINSYVVPHRNIFTAMRRNNILHDNVRLRIALPTTSTPLHTTMVALSSGNTTNRHISADNPQTTRLLTRTNCRVIRRILLPSTRGEVRHRLVHLTSDERISLVVAANNANLSLHSIAPRTAVTITAHGIPNVTRTVHTRSLGVAQQTVLDHNIDIIHKRALVIGLPNDAGTIRRTLTVILPRLRRKLHVLGNDTRSYTEG